MIALERPVLEPATEVATQHIRKRAQMALAHTCMVRTAVRRAVRRAFRRAGAHLHGLVQPSHLFHRNAGLLLEVGQPLSAAAGVAAAGGGGEGAQ
jgi:hypothetical protein